MEKTHAEMRQTHSVYSGPAKLPLEIGLKYVAFKRIKVEEKAGKPKSTLDDSFIVHQHMGTMTCAAQILWRASILNSDVPTHNMIVWLHLPMQSRHLLE